MKHLKNLSMTSLNKIGVGESFTCEYGTLFKRGTKISECIIEIDKKFYTEKELIKK